MAPSLITLLQLHMRNAPKSTRNPYLDVDLDVWAYIGYLLRFLSIGWDIQSCERSSSLGCTLGLVLQCRALTDGLECNRFHHK